MINKVILVGRVGKDPELRHINKGSHDRAVVNFPLATHELVNDKKTGNKTEIVEWHNIEMWERNAENAAKILRKGRVVYIEGKIKSESWTDSDGNKRYSTKIRANLFQVLSYLGNNPKNQSDDESDINSEELDVMIDDLDEDNYNKFDDDFNS